MVQFTVSMFDHVSEWAIDVGLHARRDYLDRHGTPRNMAALAEHAVIGYDQPNAFIRDVSRTLPGFRHATFSMRADSDLAQLALSN
ncbi:hypothetical protein [Caballeronia grimmiae]|uniref:Uncharacterized protein n=1 Tax=Caballeronia grimmiae TaxID=1071679 RepID=A0ABQ1RQH6_9BURK|nr:hypothetical protein [Caballeronia grimmiae]GGD74519.1 hypothetical protein GCM10010985_31230 [Caballeronia grimmiae]